MNLVYQAYGHQDILEQTLFSILSLLSKTGEPSSIKVIVYTDRKAWFDRFFEGAQYDIEFVEISDRDLKKWRGAIDFVHRVKIEVLKDASQRYPGPVFYCDGDTYFNTDPTDLFSRVNDQNSLMHICEAQLGKPKDPLTKKINRFVKNNVFEVNGEEVRISSEAEMWNAGVIGISGNNTKFFDQILELTDRMYVLYPKHVMEQLAVSYILQKNTQLFSAEKEIYHYWNQKPEYQICIQRFFANYPKVQVALAAYGQFEFPPPPTPKVSVVKQVWQMLFRGNP